MRPRRGSAPRSIARLIRVAGVGMTAVLASCVFTQLEMKRVEPAQLPGQTFPSSLKVHLHDGSTVVYPRGASTTRTELTGDGTRFALDLTSQAMSGPIAIDSIAAAEWYTDGVNVGATAFTTTVVAVGILMVLFMLFITWLITNMFSGANLTGF